MSSPLAAVAAYFAGDKTIPHLLLAVLLGSAIGVERQWRQRTAGLRTYALVSLGAASFVDLAGTISSPSDMTRVIAYVVSGVGFLGAGAIMKEGVNVRGLNTAATIWCSAAVGASAATGEFIAATSTCALVIGVNLFLRPIIARLDRRVFSEPEHETSYCVRVLCGAQHEAHVRALLLHGFGEARLSLRELDSVDMERPGPATVEVSARVAAVKRYDAALERIAGRISLEPSVSAVRWTIEADDGAA